MPPTLAIFLLACFVGGLIAYLVLRERKRRAGWKALAAKYDLQIDPRKQIAPSPEIRGIFFRARTYHYMQGEVSGIPAVAFDFVIGAGGNATLGSGVGIQREKLMVKAPHGLAVFYEEDWTFLYSKYFFIRSGRLRAEEIENACNLLLRAAGQRMVSVTDYET